MPGSDVAARGAAAGRGRGSAVSLRALGPTSHNLDSLEAVTTLGATGRTLLEPVVAARLAFLAVGGTGSVKTAIAL